MSCSASSPEPFLIDKGVEQTVRSGKNGCEERKRLKTGLSDRCSDRGDGQSDGGWKQEEPATKQTDISENRVMEGERLKWEETSEWQRQRDKWLEAGRRSVSACSLPPPPSINFLLQQETLTLSFLLLLGPINNLICCHMIAPRPGTRLPSLLYSNELKLFRLHQLQWARFIKAQPSPISKMADVRGEAAVGMVHLLRWFEKEKKKQKSTLMAAPAGGFIYWTLIQFYNSHKGQLLFCLVSFYFKAPQVSEVV